MIDNFFRSDFAMYILAPGVKKGLDLVMIRFSQIELIRLYLMRFPADLKDDLTDEDVKNYLESMANNFFSATENIIKTIKFLDRYQKYNSVNEVVTVMVPEIEQKLIECSEILQRLAKEYDLKNAKIPNQEPSSEEKDLEKIS